MAHLTWVPEGDTDYRLRNDPNFLIVIAKLGDCRLYNGIRLLHRAHSLLECVNLVRANFDGLEAGFNFGDEHGSELSPLPSGPVPKGS